MQRGFTLIEVMIVVVMVIIAAVIAMSVIAGFGNGNNSISFGITGVVETRCINGYQFIVGQDGSVRQVMNEFGHGAPCNVNK